MFGFIWEKKAKLESTKYKVAVLMGMRKPVVEEFLKGFSETLKKSDSNAEYDIKVYDAQMDHILMRKYADEILSSSFDLLYSCDTVSTLTVSEIAKKKKYTMPVVFSGIRDPKERGVVLSLDNSGNNFTGIRANYDKVLQVDLLCALKPDARRVLLIYDPSALGGSMGNVVAKQVEAALCKNGVEAKHGCVFNPNEIVSKIEGFMENVDAIMIFNDGIGDAGIACLVKLCNKYHVSLYGSSRQHVEKGAAIALGYDEYYNGVMVAKKALKILVDGIKPTDIPVTSATESARFIINIEASKKQNLNIDKNLLFLILNGEIFDASSQKKQI